MVDLSLASEEKFDWLIFMLECAFLLAYGWLLKLCLSIYWLLYWLIDVMFDWFNSILDEPLLLLSIVIKLFEVLPPFVSSVLRFPIILVKSLASAKKSIPDLLRLLFLLMFSVSLYVLGASFFTSSILTLRVSFRV